MRPAIPLLLLLAAGCATVGRQPVVAQTQATAEEPWSLPPGALASNSAFPPLVLEVFGPLGTKGGAGLAGGGNCASPSAACSGAAATFTSLKLQSPAGNVQCFDLTSQTGFSIGLDRSSSQLTMASYGTDDCSGSATTMQTWNVNLTGTTIPTVAVSTAVTIGATLAFSATAPTISSAFGTSPSITAGRSVAFRLNVGTGGVATSGVIGLPAATTGWNCFCNDITTKSSTVFSCMQTASSTTSATVGNFNTSGAAAAWVGSDILAVNCTAY